MSDLSFAPYATGRSLSVSLLSGGLPVYTVALTESTSASGFYYGTIGAGLAAGEYSTLVYDQGQAVSMLGTLTWDGAQEVKTGQAVWTYSDRALTDKAGFDLDLAEPLDTSNGGDTVGGSLLAARAEGFGVWKIAGTPGTPGATLRLYAADGVTVVRTFDLSTAGSRL